MSQDCSPFELKSNVSRCSHLLANPENLIDRPSPHSFSHTRLPLFGKSEVGVNELVNPSNFHFRVVSVENSTCSGSGDWQGGDTWYPGFSWRVCYCPLCG